MRTHKRFALLLIAAMTAAPAVLLAQRFVRPQVETSSTAADSLRSRGGITAGSGNVAIVDTTGKIPALSSIYLANLSGANLTSLPASQLTGSIDDARLSSNVPLKNAANTFTADQAVTGKLQLGQAGASNAYLNAAHSMIFNVDSDASGAGDAFIWQNNTTGDGTALMQLTEAGAFNVNGNGIHRIGTAATGTLATTLKIEGQGNGATGNGGAAIQFVRNTLTSGWLGSRSQIYGTARPDAMVVSGVRSDGVEILADDPAGDIRFYTGAGITLRGEMTDAGVFHWLGGFRLGTSAVAGRVLTTDASGNGTWQDSGVASGAVPTGGIMAFKTACPVTWTRVSEWDGRFLRGGATYVAAGGGSDTHGHDVVGSTAGAGGHNHGGTTGTNGDHFHTVTQTSEPTGTGDTVNFPTGNTSTDGDHNHIITSESNHVHTMDFDTSAASNVPLYSQVIFCSKD